MSPTTILLAQLQAAGVHLRVDAGKLAWRARPGALSDDLHAEMQQHRDDLLGVLQPQQPDAEKGAPGATGKRTVAAKPTNQPPATTAAAVCDPPRPGTERDPAAWYSVPMDERAASQHRWYDQDSTY